jgi:hypothetical protein
MLSATLNVDMTQRSICLPPLPERFASLLVGSAIVGNAYNRFKRIVLSQVAFFKILNGG